MQSETHWKRATAIFWRDFRTPNCTSAFPTKRSLPFPRTLRVKVLALVEAVDVPVEIWKRLRPYYSSLPTAVPTPAKRKLPMSQKVKNIGPKSSPATSSSVSLPRWGTDFPRTGFTLTGSLLERGTLKGHLSKDDC